VEIRHLLAIGVEAPVEAAVIAEEADGERVVLVSSSMLRNEVSMALRRS
jgi:hypothetical protein